MTLNELFIKYLEDIDLTHQDTTIDSICYRYNSHIREVFGNCKLEEITFIKVKKFQKNFLDGKFRTSSKKKYSVSYANIVVKLLKRLMTYANLMRYVDMSIEEIRGFETIKDAVDKNKFKEDRQIIWNLDEFNNFIKYVDDEKYEVLFNILFFCGLRKGEVLSLRWQNIDLLEETITINSTACKVSGVGQIVKSPKTVNSYRTIYINKSLKELILNYYVNEKSVYNKNINNHFVFGGINMISFTTLDRNFKKYKINSNSTDMNLHGFRHSHATMMLSITNDLYNVSKRLGHDSIEITELYLHGSSKAQKELAIQLENAVENKKNSNYGNFIQKLEKFLLSSLTNPAYDDKQVNEIKEVYDFVKRQQKSKI
ncbi:tyrosine-type recombinase/integrase [Thomasclavelia cocleata]|uniref:tyrosine-type recombinase/integrase n=1 Tax=Thomasclavelia cocleata TaxID=69824 RepID=UPI00242EED7C|nr:site-specific integrase [Thomasclavelia cocleata]